jgi:Cytochrome P460
MKKTVSLIACIAGLALTAADQPAADGPHFTSDGQLTRPENYREWVYLSSGLGMTYGPVGAENADRAVMFDNVFVTRAAYKSFLQTGKWPDKTMFVLEVRASESKASINNGGRFQTNLVAIEAEVKDERFPGKWAFFGFGKDASVGKMFPTTATCYSCHSQKGAVDNTFVQFYPTLVSVAREKGTLKTSTTE